MVIKADYKVCYKFCKVLLLGIPKETVPPQSTNCWDWWHSGPMFLAQGQWPLHQTQDLDETTSTQDAWQWWRQPQGWTMVEMTLKNELTNSTDEKYRRGTATMEEDVPTQEHRPRMLPISTLGWGDVTQVLCLMQGCCITSCALSRLCLDVHSRHLHNFPLLTSTQTPTQK